MAFLMMMMMMRTMKKLKLKLEPICCGMSWRLFFVAWMLLAFSSRTQGLQGALIACERLRIPGYSRLANLHKYPHTVRVKVESTNTPVHKFKSSVVDVCFHGNNSLELGQCAKESWYPLEKGVWTAIKSPFQTKYLDIRAIESFTETPLVVSSQEELHFFRVALLVVGTLLLLIAPVVSKWVPFYYSSAMTLGILLVVLILLYQGMKLLPTGRKSTLYIVMYGSLVGFGTVILRYIAKLLSPILLELGLDEGTLNPVAAFLLIGVVVMGAWLGFWGVRKLVLTGDGSVDDGTAEFVKWAIRLVGAVMLLQSSVDGLFALVGLLFGILISSVGKSFIKILPEASQLLWSIFKESKYRLHFSPSPYRNNVKFQKKDAHSGVPFPVSPSSPQINSSLKNEQDFYSTFHSTTRKQFSKREWDEFTKTNTQQAVRELLASSDFSNWVLHNAGRIKIIPNEVREERADDEIELTAAMEETDTSGWF
ncbi:hypothetical protein O6H91_Y259700 [Diphasiastrum complanatum]|nr:hypothetical protein O6H91_Y259700 [Diphasiastrum complanatum]